MNRLPRHPVSSVAVIGECMLELDGAELGTLRQSFGGDTFNTAVYLARLAPGTPVAYVTVLGSDSLSDMLCRHWQDEGIDTTLVLRDPARLPGLYQIQTDAHGERRFLYWRSDSAARYLVQHPDFDRIAGALAQADLVYLSSISLAILPEPDRHRLIELLGSLADRGIPIAFDTNYRPSLWSSAAAARAAIGALLPKMSLLFASFDDEHRLWGDDTADATVSRYRASKIPTVIKVGPGGCLHCDGDEVITVATAAAACVVDTTAAGDSFNAAYLAARLAGAGPILACRAGNVLAGIVISHRGAIIPASATPSLRDLLESG